MRSKAKMAPSLTHQQSSHPGHFTYPIILSAAVCLETLNETRPFLTSGPQADEDLQSVEVSPTLDRTEVTGSDASGESSHAHTHTHTHTHAHTHTRTHAHAHTHTHSRTHAHTRTRLHTHTHTHTRTFHDHPTW